MNFILVVYLILLVLKSVAEEEKLQLKLCKNWADGNQKIIASLTAAVLVSANTSHRMYKLRKRFIHPQ